MVEISKNVMDRREAIKRTALMLGLAMSSSAVSSALGQATQRMVKGSGARFLSEREFALVDALAELILPRSDTPGARDVGVPEFVDTSFGKFMKAYDQSVLRDGLAGFDKVIGGDFVGMTRDEQEAAYQNYVDDKAGRDGAFLRALRDHVLIGYFTSEEVGRNVLRFDPIPGAYKGCIPWEAGMANWTL